MSRSSDPVTAYLDELAAELKALGARDAEDLTAEVRSHLADALAEAPDADPAVVVSGFGTPAALARELLAERDQGAREATVAVAGPLRRTLAWVADLVWALWPTALLWPVAYLVAQVVRVSPAPAGLLLSWASVPVAWGLTALAAVAAVFPCVALARAALARRSGRPTIGTRVAGMVSRPGDGAAAWMPASAARQAGVPGVIGRPRAVIGIVVAVAVIAVGAAWVPTLALLGDRQEAAEQAEGQTRESQEQALAAVARGWTRELYFSAIEGSMDALVERGDRGFGADAELLRTFAASVTADGVSSVDLGLEDRPPVMRVDDKQDSFVVTIFVVEKTAAGDNYATVVFDATDPQGGSFGADQSWQLVDIRRDELRRGSTGPEAFDARAAVQIVIGLGGADSGATGKPGVDLPMRMTSEFAGSDQGRMLIASWDARPGEQAYLGDRREIVRVRYRPDAAVVETIEEWYPAGADRSVTEHYEYVVVAGEDRARVAERRRIDR